MPNGTIIALPAEPRRRPRKSARRAARRRARLLQITLALAAALAAVTAWINRPWDGAHTAYQAVELVYQNPELPNGCEITSLSMALGAAGYPADKLTLYRDYLPKGDFSYDGALCYGPNPEKWYVGDAADLKGGFYCFETPIIQAANGWLDERGSASRARSVTGLSRETLNRYAEDGVPLVAWVTLGYAQPQYSEFSWTLEDGTQYQPYSNLHCVVLAGTQDGQYRIADPLNGFVLVEKNVFWDSFSAMGCRAVVIE